MKQYIYPFLLCLVAAACSGGDEPAAPQRTSMTISSRAPENNAEDKELINDWWMALVDANGTVARIVERTDKSRPVDYETVEVGEIARGTYTIYAFANMGTERFGFVEGQKAPADIESRTWSRVPDYGTDLMPMSGKLRAELPPRSSERVVVEVVRLTAKMKLDIKSRSSLPVTVNKMRILNAKNGSVGLMPDYSTLSSPYPGTVGPALLPGTTLLTLERDIHIDFEAGYTGDARSEIFYLLESTASGHPTGRYVFEFDVKKGDHNETISILAYEFPWINRNDFLTLPITIADWTVELDIKFYPPIGGYPAVMLESKGNEFYARFGSSGKFVINPTVKYSVVGNTIPPADYDVRIDHAKIEDPDGILKTKPVLDATTREIIGEIDVDKTGTAIVTLEFTVKEGSSQQTFIRKIYIIR